MLRILSAAAAMVAMTLGGVAAAQIRASRPVPIENVTIDDPFWSPKLKTWRDVTIKDVFDKFERDGAIDNFQRVADGKTGGYQGEPWFDGLLYETITGASGFLRTERDEALEARIDGYIDVIDAASRKIGDGYLHCFVTLERPGQRWGRNGGMLRFQHDIYNQGCLIEAGVAYYRATAKTRLLEVAVRSANHQYDAIGPEADVPMVPGHAVSERALIDLWRLFEEQPELAEQLEADVRPDDYLALAKSFIDNRGHHAGRENLEAYAQDDKPVTEMTDIGGHAVRAVLVGEGVTALGIATGEQKYIDAGQRLFDSMAGRRMYVTGGVGSIEEDEKFGPDYELPNDGYAETCAAVGTIQFARQLQLATGDTSADASIGAVIERVLYNAALVGTGLSGDCYFYVNPLHADATERWHWHGCPCCPPMFLKLMGELPSLIYSVGEDKHGVPIVYIDQFIGSTATLTIKGQPVTIKMTSSFPFIDADQAKGNTLRENVNIRVDAPDGVEFYVKLRKPEWARQRGSYGELYVSPKLKTGRYWVIQDEMKLDTTGEDNYATLLHPSQWGKTMAEERRGIALGCQMPPRRIVADKRIQAANGRVAFARGPIIYCLESTDVDAPLNTIFVPDDAKVEVESRPDLLGGVDVLKVTGKAMPAIGRAEDIELTLVPFYANSNRGVSSHRVWLPTSSAARPTHEQLATPSASHVFENDTVTALSDRKLPKSSHDESVPRMTFWDHRGNDEGTSVEWVQYDWKKPIRSEQIGVYWWDETALGRDCRVPKSWRLLYRDEAGDWQPVDVRDDGRGRVMPTKLDQMNIISFIPVHTTGMRLEVTLQPGFSAGILEWHVDPVFLR